VYPLADQFEALPLYLSQYIEAHKSEYYASLKAAQQQLDWAAAVAFLADAITGSVDELMVTGDALRSLAQAWRARHRFRQHSAAFAHLSCLPATRW
jgi:Fic family protein